MKPVIELENAQIFHGNSLEVLKHIPDNSIDAIVTDPPYGLNSNDYVAETIAKWIGGERDFIPDGKGFMGKSWDSFVPPPAIWDECLRVLKPGGHLLAFFGSRTQDIGALSIRLAGFEIRDSIAWLYGSGFPKSHNISKAIDKALGAEREVVGINPNVVRDSKLEGGSDFGGFTNANAEITASASPEAIQWDGWGTALKPAIEPIVMARKPLEGTVAENVLKYGTGGINIDATRIGFTSEADIAEYDFNNNGQNRSTKKEGESLEVHEGGWKVQKGEKTIPSGRFPANIILDEHTAELLDKQSGFSKSSGTINRWTDGAKPFGGGAGHNYESIQGVADSGGASRFFYVAKANKKDRNEGLDELPKIQFTGGEGLTAELDEEGYLRTDSAGGKYGSIKAPKQNFHPTVKPTELMRYLVKLVCPPNGTVLDPFTGSGSTGKASLLEGFKFIGIELTDEYLPIIEGRLKHIEEQRKENLDNDLFA